MDDQKITDIQAVKRGRGRPKGSKSKPGSRAGGNGGATSPVIGDNGIKTKPGDNARYAWMAGEVISWGEVDRKNISALEDRFKRYIDLCIQNDVKPGNLAAYAALGIDKDIAYDWSQGRGPSASHADFIKKVKGFCAIIREQLMVDGKVKEAVGIFWQKNYDGLKDIQDINLSPLDPLGQPRPPEERAAYIKQIGDGMPDIDD